MSIVIRRNIDRVTHTVLVASTTSEEQFPPGHENALWDVGERELSLEKWFEMAISSCKWKIQTRPLYAYQGVH
jgi:hypothetical protein